MNKSKKELIIVAAVAAAVLALLLLFASIADAQTPPVSTVGAMEDTTYSIDIDIHFTVSSDIAWDQGGGCGVYYRIPGTTEGWLYISASYSSPLAWTVPYPNATYEFCATTEDNDGNNEGHNHQPEASTYIAVGDPLPCPDPTVMQAAVVMAENGIYSFGQPNVPKVRWHWTHPTTGTLVETYTAEWMVVPIGTCDTTISVFSGIAAGDTTFAQLDVPYTPGASQTLRVQGVDALSQTGPFSQWGIPFLDQGAPGTPDAPKGTLVLEEQ